MVCKKRSSTRRSGSGARWALPILLLAAALGALSATACSEENAQGPGTCIPRSTQECSCVYGQTGMQVCAPDGSGFSQCVCGPADGDPASGGNPAAGGTGGGAPGSQPPAGGQSGASPNLPQQDAGAAGSAGQAQQPPTGGTAGDSGATPPEPLDSGTSDGSGQNPPATTDAGAAVDTGPPDPSNPDDPLDAARQACVDHINQYRATLNLAPLRRGTPEQEACSDLGAQQDATTGGVHSSAGSCAGLGAQNTCPNWSVGGFGGSLESTIRTCLDGMWSEGEPPVPVDQCIRDYVGCFLQYGHYINMSSPTSGVVSCGFYESSPGVWWMNQDFGY